MLPDVKMHVHVPMHVHVHAHMHVRLHVHMHVHLHVHAPGSRRRGGARRARQLVSDAKHADPSVCRADRQ